MLARKNDSLNGKELPKEWIDDINDILRKLHLEHCEQRDRVFDAYGMMFTDELLLTISFVKHTDLTTSPVTYLVSIDIDEKTDTKKALETMVDGAGHFFEQYFLDKDWNNFFDMWQEESFGKMKIFHKVTRENIRLTLEAEKLLKS